MKKNHNALIVIVRAIIISVLALIVLSCQSNSSRVAGGKVNVLSTTSIVGDVVDQIGGVYIQTNVLLPRGTDPHTFTPTPQDAVKISDADIIFANGAGLETFLQRLIDSVGGKPNVLYVSDGVVLRKFSGEQVSQSSSSTSLEDDPHTWTDPNNVKIWVDNIVQALSKADPSHADKFQENATLYQQQLDGLDSWIRSRVAELSPDNRNLVADHLAWGYFSDRYGFKLVGAVIPSYSTLAEPSAQELAQLEEAIRSLNVKALFVDKSINPALSEQVAQDTGIKIVFLYTGSLSPQGEEASSYLDYMHYNVNAIVDALK